MSVATRPGVLPRCTPYPQLMLQERQLWESLSRGFARPLQ